MHDLPFQYKTTHPWITFELDIARIGLAEAILAGQIAATLSHIASMPLTAEVAKRVEVELALLDAHGSAALEGNPLRQSEVFARLRGETLPGEKEHLGVEIDNIVAAAQWIDQQHAAGTLPALSIELIAALNRRVLAGLHFEQEVIPGRLRGYAITAADYHGAPAEDLHKLMTRLCDWVSRPWFEGSNFHWLDATLKSALVHAYLMWIYPYDAANGPTARLAGYCLLVAAGAPRGAGHLLGRHYYKTHAQYNAFLDESSAKKNDAVRFCQYALSGFAACLRDFASDLQQQQARFAWRERVILLLSGSEAAERQRDLILALADRNESLEKYDLPEVSDHVAAIYATLNEKTFNRDLQALQNLGLLEVDGEGLYRAVTPRGASSPQTR